MKITHLIPYVGAAQGGPVHALEALSRAQHSIGHSVHVLALTHPSDGAALPFASGVKVNTIPAHKLGPMTWHSDLYRAALASPAEIFHSHGLWTDASHTAHRAAASRQLPHVLAPCGMLAPDALARSFIKKRVARLLFQDRVLKSASCLHAKSDLECSQIRRFGLRNPVAVVPNPIDAPAPDTLEPAAFDAAHGVQRGRYVLFLGRLHAVKGIPRLLEAWQRSGVANEGWRLVVAGPDEGGYGPLLAKHAPYVVSVGALDSVMKWSAIEGAAGLVLPSDFENFGTSAAEALFAGTPVIATHGTPWTQLNDHGAGWHVAATPDALANALCELTAMPREIYLERCEAARALGTRFEASRVASEMLSVYAWLCEGGQPPACIQNEP